MSPSSAGPGYYNLLHYGSLTYTGTTNVALDAATGGQWYDSTLFVNTTGASLPATTVLNMTSGQVLLRRIRPSPD